MRASVNRHTARRDPKGGRKTVFSAHALRGCRLRQRRGGALLLFRHHFHALQFLLLGSESLLRLGQLVAQFGDRAARAWPWRRENN
jgi:hypothetical protein